ncbi:probable purine permease 10 isoform X4 [Quercus lobata]|nr:probable purine permease 10 isoform X4 [Quercus lobata]
MYMIHLLCTHILSRHLYLSETSLNSFNFDMKEAQELQLHIMTPLEAKEANSTTEHINVTSQSTITQPRNYGWWLRISMYTLFLLSGQSIALLLGRLYYDKGGKSKWLGVVVQLIGFPLLLPYYFIPSLKNLKTNSTATTIFSKPPSTLVHVSVYVSLGLLVVANCFLYSTGLMYLPVSTFSLICASQLAFNAFFSSILNSQKFTPLIVNSLVLLTISSILLVFETDPSSDSSKVSKKKYVIGLICTICASAGHGWVLSLTQVAFKKVFKKETFTAVMDMIIYQSLVATLGALVGLFASGDWKGLKTQMDEFELGKVSYIMTLVWTAIMWEVSAIGCVGLIFEVSSLFSNAISVLGLPIVPVLAAIFFHDKIGGIKVISMVLAIWGFVSYVYQQYLDDLKSKQHEDRNANEASNTSSLQEVNGS